MQINNNEANVQYYTTLLFGARILPSNCKAQLISICHPTSIKRTHSFNCLWAVFSVRFDIQAITQEQCIRCILCHANTKSDGHEGDTPSQHSSEERVRYSRVAVRGEEVSCNGCDNGNRQG